jgi:hypothetical protein
MRTALFFFGLILALAACGDVPAFTQSTYTPPVSSGGLMCITQCGKSHSYCGWSCDLDYRSCVIDVQGAAQREYDVYATYRLAHQAPVDLLPEDFEHPEKCMADKKSCQAACDRPYDTCYSSCGGTVTPPDACSFMCAE